MMKKSENRKNFDKLISDKKSGWLDDAVWMESNQAWLDKSAHIAIRILSEIHRQKPVNGMTQKKLAEAMDVSPQYINKIVKGKENLTLETISKIESVLGIKLISVEKENVITKQIKVPTQVEKPLVSKNQKEYTNLSYQFISNYQLNEPMPNYSQT